MKAPGHIPYEQYAAIEALNMSSLIEIDTSPKHYLWFKQHPKQDKACYRLGRAGHTAILEPMQFLREYALSGFKDFRTDAAKEWRDEQVAAGKTVLTAQEYWLAEQMREAVLAHKRASSYLRGGRHECTITWTDQWTGLACKGRLDYVSHALSDLKSTRHIKQYPFGRDAAKLYYPTKLAWYHDGLLAATGEDLPVVIIAMESAPPFDVVVYPVSPEQLAVGRTHYEQLLDRLLVCLETNQWPGVAETEDLPLILPAWNQHLEEEPILLDGEPLF